MMNFGDGESQIAGWNWRRGEAASGERWRLRSSWHCSRASVERGNDEEHQAKSFFCVCLQRSWRANRGGSVVPVLRFTLESDDRGRCDEP